MLRIAVCDDERGELLNIRRILVNALKGKKADIQMFNNGNDLLAALNDNMFDIVTLDIDMPEISGFDIAKKLYEVRYGDNLIFVSNMEELVFESLSFRPFRFVRKAKLGVELEKAVCEWIDRYGENSTITIKVNGMDKTLCVSDIVYMEIQGHNLYIHTVEEEFVIRQKISSYEYLTEESTFIKIHSSFLCNMKYIQEISGNMCVLWNGTQLKITNTKVSTCKKTYMKFLRSR